MKLTISILLFGVMAATAGSSYSQTARINLKMKDASLVDVFREIERTSEFGFFFKSEELDMEKKVSIDLTNANIEEILKKVLIDNYSYRILDKNIVVTRGSINNTSEQQQKSVSGKVTDTTGAPIPGTSVVVKGTTTGVISDMDGKYTISKVPENAILQFSFVGMKTQEVVVGTQTSINITMVEEAIGLEEVVAVGYGIQKKKLVTGATVEVKGDDLKKLNTISPFTALQSQTPGVQITSVSGKPGEGYKINIRGLGTIGNSEPLVIIDDIVGGDLNMINPNDIESIDILKDAASAAVYGSRAANGVILVKTKGGKVGKPVISYNGYFGVQNVSKYIDMVNAQDYMKLVSESYTNKGHKAPDWSKKLRDWDKIQAGWPGTNWVKEFAHKNAPQQSHSFGLDGGTDISKYSIGFSYTSQEGILGQPVTPKYDRYSLRINSDYVVLKKSGRDVIKIGENLLYNFVQKDHSGLATGGTYWSQLHNLQTINPLLTPYDNNGNYSKPNNGYDGMVINPIGFYYYGQSFSTNRNHDLRGSIYLEVQPIKGLRIKSNFGYNLNAYSNRSYVPIYNLGGTSGNNIFDRTNQGMGIGLGYQVQNTLTYNIKISDNHNIEALAGQSFEQNGLGESLNGSNRNSIFSDQASFDYAYLDNMKTIIPGNIGIGGSPYGMSAIASFFGRVNYDFKETYMVTLVVRNDGSSNFAPGKRWGTFPSASAGWIISNEPFMRPVSNVVDYLKLRASWGQNGNQAILPFQYNSTIAFSGGDYIFGVDKTKPTTGAYPSIIPNKDVTWEKSEQTDIGVDAHFLSSRLVLAMDFYNKTTKGWLVQAPVLASWGAAAPYINGGDIQNKGLEVALNWKDNVGKDLTYGVRANISFNQNKVTRLANSDSIITGNGEFANGMDGFYRAQVGYPIGYFYGMQTAGIFQNQEQIDAYQEAKRDDAKPGDMIWVDTNHDGMIDNNTDRTMIGNPNPKFTFGLGFNMGWKGFDFSLTANGVYGNKIASALHMPDKHMTNFPAYMMGRWHGDGTSNTLPILSDAKSDNYLWFSSIYLHDGSFLRIQNVTLGYDFKKLMPNIVFGQLRLYVAAQNLFTFTKYYGMDPEVGYGDDDWAKGIDTGFYPNPRTIMGGISVKF